MNKKKILLLFFLIMLLLPTRAQELLSQDFESGVFPDKGWSAIQEPTAGGHWRSSDYIPLAGKFGLYIDEKRSSAVADYDPQKEEYVITPSIALPADVDYGFKFLWQAQSIGILEKKSYDLIVAVSEDNGATWTRIWWASDKESLERSGVIYPWANWSKNTSTVSLKNYKGKTVKIALIYKLIIPADGNMVKLDNVSVIPHTAIESPIVSGSTSYRFENAYIGVKQKSSESLFVTNQGIGELKINSIEGLTGTDFSTDLDPAKVSISSQNSQFFNVYFTPTEEGAASTTMVLKTNGGDLSIALSGSKTGFDAGYSLESFEGSEFPPTGWTNSKWTSSTVANSGDKAANANFENLATLTSPRLTLPTGNNNITFDYAVALGEEVEEAPVNDFYLEFSKNGGATWSTIWTSTDYADLPYTRVTVKTGSMVASDNCYIRWVYKISGTIDFETVCSSIYLDNVVLPPIYGANLKPTPVTNPVPAAGSVNQYVNDLKLSWRSTLHTNGYKLYVGTDSSNPTSVVNGTVLGKDVLSSVLNGLSYNTTYYWKVVPFNAQGDAENVQTWSFTTMEDMSISTFPYFNGFEEGGFPPVGWITSTTGAGSWSSTTSYPYDGKVSLTAYTYKDDNSAILQMPEIIVPTNTDIQISFVWGNGVPANLTKSTSETTVTGGDSIYFEVKTPGSEWKTLAICSQNDEVKKWLKQKVLLSDYKGQRLTARWRYHAMNVMKAGRAALDNVEIIYVSSKGVPVINFTEWVAGRNQISTRWNAGIANYKQTNYSGEIFNFSNEGEYELKIKSVGFKTEFFKPTILAADYVLPANKSTKFGIEFNAVKAQELVEDTLTIEFVDGQKIEFPVYGSAMGQNSYCYTFDNLQHGATVIPDFTTIDQDGFATVPLAGINYPGKGGAIAFKVINWETSDWRNVFPRSGNQVLAAFGADESTNTPTKESVDWLITKQLTPQDNAQLRFYAKSYAADDIWFASKLTVLVSTTTNDIASFTAVPTFTDVEIPAYADDKLFKECIVDLSQYKGQNIYVAVRHNVKGGLALFIDDLYLENFQFSAPGNRAPSFLTTPSQAAIKVGETYTYDFAVSDPDNDPVTITIKGLPKWLTYVPRTNGGTLTGVPTTSDNYLLKIEASDGALSTSQDVEITVDPKNGITGNVVNVVSVYPNPVTSVLHIVGATEKVTLSDITGKQVFAGEKVNEISVDNLSNGVYILKVYSEGSVYTTKIIKK